MTLLLWPFSASVVLRHFVSLLGAECGVAVGVATGVVPTYLSEISPIGLRGGIGTAHQYVPTMSTNCQACSRQRPRYTSHQLLTGVRVRGVQAGHHAGHSAVRDAVDAVAAPAGVHVALAVALRAAVCARTAAARSHALHPRVARLPLRYVALRSSDPRAYVSEEDPQAVSTWDFIAVLALCVSQSMRGKRPRAPPSGFSG